MRVFTTVTCITFLLAFNACSSNRSNTPDPNYSATRLGGEANRADAYVSQSASLSSSQQGSAKIVPASLIQAEQVQETQQVAVERKIIRDAELTVELAAPAEGQRKLAAIAEAHGGFVVTSESKQQDNASSETQAGEIVNVTLRIPAAQFDAAIGEIRAIGNRVRTEKITGKDVTEEFIDLEARLRTQRALEAQYLEIMKRANAVSDALEVNKELAEVRTGIEQVEGRRRFLENQAALSTIKVTLQLPAPLVSATTSGFFSGLKHAFGDGVDIAAAIILGLIRIGIALIPILLFIVLPVVLLWRFLRARLRRRRLSRQQTPPPSVTNASA